MLFGAQERNLRVQIPLAQHPECARCAGAGARIPVAQITLEAAGRFAAAAHLSQQAPCADGRLEEAAGGEDERVRSGASGELHRGW
jgi:hypothetical protein